MAERANATSMVAAGIAVDMIAATLLAERDHGTHPPIVLIDGRSGAGKSTIASQVGARVSQAVIIRLDDVYPGWHGLEAARRQLLSEILTPRAEGRPARWQRWDWAAETAGEWVPVDGAAPLIVEGVGTLSRASRELAELTLWVELDADARKSRALARDGDAFAPHWDQWARDEDDFIAREHPHDLADVVIDGRTIAPDGTLAPQ